MNRAGHPPRLIQSRDRETAHLGGGNWEEESAEQQYLEHETPEVVHGNTTSVRHYDVEQFRQLPESGEYYYSESLAGLRVLIVEDKASNRDALADALARSGASVLTGVNAADARAKLDGDRFHAAIVDRSLPDGDGGDLAREIRGNPVHAGPRLVLQ